MKESLIDAMKDVCDAAHNFASRWEHKGKCRICDEAMEVLVAKLNELAKEINNDNQT